MINMYTEGHKAGKVQKLPLNLLDALRLLEKNSVLADAWGKETVKSYVKLKMLDWQDFSSQLTEWEKRTTLDC